MDFNGFLTVAKETFPDITERMEASFRAMEGLYNDWNAKINVISRKDIDSLYIRHILHSLAIAAYLKEVRPMLLSLTGLITRRRNLRESMRLSRIFPELPSESGRLIVSRSFYMTLCAGLSVLPIAAGVVL